MGEGKGPVVAHNIQSHKQCEPPDVVRATGAIFFESTCGRRGARLPQPVLSGMTDQDAGTLEYPCASRPVHLRRTDDAAPRLRYGAWPGDRFLVSSFVVPDG